MVSIITCTIREEHMANIFKNYEQQTMKEKELIIILNKNSLDLEAWKKEAENYPQVSVYQLDENCSLGACLNFGAAKAKYKIIAKFDDDDYYGPKYVKESVKELKRQKVSIVGKRAYYAYLESSDQLLLVTPRFENQLVHHVAGASFVFKKKVLKQVPFRDLEVGTDSDFIKRCKKEGYNIYSTSKHYFAIIRRKNLQSHTWKITDDELIRSSKSIAFSDDFRLTVDNSKDQH